MATTKKASTSKPKAIMKEIEKKRKAGASASELNKLRERYLSSLTYNTPAKKKRK